MTEKIVLGETEDGMKLTAQKRADGMVEVVFNNGWKLPPLRLSPQLTGELDKLRGQTT